MRVRSVIRFSTTWSLVWVMEVKICWLYWQTTFRHQTVSWNSVLQTLKGFTEFSEFYAANISTCQFIMLNENIMGTSGFEASPSSWFLKCDKVRLLSWFFRLKAGFSAGALEAGSSADTTATENWLPPHHVLGVTQLGALIISLHCLFSSHRCIILSLALLSVVNYILFCL